MAPKRKSDASDNSKDGEAGPSTKAAKTSSSGKSADKLGLTLKVFESTAPNLGAAIFTTSSERSKKGELLNFDLQKQKMSSGSFGWTGAGKRINVEVEIDGEKKMVQAQVTLNITVLGSKKADEASGSKNSDDE